MRRILPVLVLLILSPMVAEILLGSTLLSKLSFVTFLLYIGFYGTGAVLIRELAHRRSLSWSRIVVLGLAFGMIEEGLVTQSLFNPHFPGIGYLRMYGRWLGVNWYWAEYILGWHAVWSISIPVLLAELLFPARKSQPWLGRIGLGAVDAIFVLVGLSFAAIHHSLTGFIASPVLLACAALLVVGLMRLALFMPRHALLTSSERSIKPPPSNWLIALLALVAGIVWLGNHKLISPTFALPALVLILFLAALVVVVVLLIRRWSAQDIRLPLASGGLLAGELVGLKIVQNGTTTDLIVLAVLCAATMTALALFTWKTRRHVADPGKTV
jgi:hypothetical protein